MNNTKYKTQTVNRHEILLHTSGEPYTGYTILHEVFEF